MGARSDNGVTGRARVVEKSRDGTAAQKTTVSDDTLPPGGASRHDWPVPCCRIVLTALCVMCAFAAAWAATFVAARAARVPHGRKAACIHGRPACAFVRQSRPKAPLREPFLPLLAPLHAALAAGGASVASMERGARARSGFACRAWLRATNGRRSAGGASLHTPLTRRASGGQGYVQHYSAAERWPVPCCRTVPEQGRAPRIAPCMAPRVCRPHRQSGGFGLG